MLGRPEAAGRALLLVWPYEGEDERGWDMEALECFEGSTVVYCGDWTGHTRAARAGESEGGSNFGSPPAVHHGGHRHIHRHI